jgi:UDP-N-acetyl-alpha-D-muramoyl-L-alanyl-L-glutamate epimerase
MNDPDRFDPASVGVFRVVDRSFETGSRTVTLRYAFDDDHEFVETITFETPTPFPLAQVPHGLEHALLHLHVAAGTSYYKAAAPRIVSVEGASLSAQELDYHHHLYDEGLREFAVTNGLEVPRPVLIRPEGGGSELVTGVRAAPDRFERPGGIVVPIGGGKDSMVLIEALRELHPLLFAVNPHPRVVELAKKAGLDLVVVRRRLSPNLDQLNRSGALNGHVPITAIISLIAVVGSFLYGYDKIAMAVERSASEETVIVDGVPVNHQYSKSLDFELATRDLIVGSIDPDLIYGSALRPYSELAIARAFARLTDYHADFCSCNRIFRQDADRNDGWCGECPKCRFVALMLAPFLEVRALDAIIGRDLFDDRSQLPGFAALMSDEGKPFECVGERRESAAAVRMLSELARWKDSPVVSALAGDARKMISDTEVAALLAPQLELAFPDSLVASSVEAMISSWHARSSAGHGSVCGGSVWRASRWPSCSPNEVRTRSSSTTCRRRPEHGSEPSPATGCRWPGPMKSPGGISTSWCEPPG